MQNAMSDPKPNKVCGAWRLIEAKLEQGDQTLSPFGDKPDGLLSFTADMHFVEVLTDTSLPRFASDVPGQGTDEENRNAMARTIGIFGVYTVDASGDLSGDKVEGCTFANWIGDVRTRKEISARVDGDRMTEAFHRPDGSTITLQWRRA